MAKKAPVIGITGAIGSGKSAFARALEAQGAAVIDADLLAREVVEPPSPALGEIASAFGAEMLGADGRLDRKRLGKLVFQDAAKRKQLEQILHPRIRALFLKRLAETQARSPKLIAYVVPLLFESGFAYDELDAIVVVAAPRDLCIKRIVARDGLSADEAARRLDSQLPIEEKSRRADYAAQNTGDLAALEKDAARVFEKYRAK